MKWYIKLLRWIWEFPQCLLGIILIYLYKTSYKETYKNIAIYTGKFPGGISLGIYIILDTYNWQYNIESVKEHEYGHSKQSLYLGWGYLPTVGLVSGLWRVLRKIFPILKNYNYYSIWTEAWADTLGGISRK